MTHAANRLVVFGLLAIAGCSSVQPPSREVVVGNRWREVKFNMLSWEASTEISVQSSEYTDFGFVVFDLRERLKAVADSAMLTPEQMASLRAAMPVGTTLVGNDRLIVDATQYTITLDGQSVTVNRENADPAMIRVLDWFNAYAATLRHSATTRPWFQ